MTVATRVTEKFEERSAREEGQHRYYTKCYEVRGEFSEATVFDAVDSVTENVLPTIWTRHGDDLSAVCTNVRVQSTGDKNVWRVYCDFTTNFNPERATSDPRLEWPEIESGFTTYRMVASHDIAGTPILNSAGDPFDPPLEDDIIVPCLIITRNESSTDYSLAKQQQYALTVNSAAVTVAGYQIPIGEGRLAEYGASPQYRRDYQYFKTRYNVELMSGLPQQWKRRLMDAGFYTHVSNVRTHIMDDSGNRVVEPQRLDGAGGTLAGSTATPSAPFFAYGGSVYADWKTKREANWSALSLPATWWKPA